LKECRPNYEDLSQAAPMLARRREIEGNRPPDHIASRLWKRRCILCIPNDAAEKRAGALAAFWKTTMMQFQPLCAGFGLETRDVDIAKPLSDAAFAELERKFYEGQVLVLRAQSLTPAQFVAFARRLGPPQPHVIDQFHHPEDANILILSNVRKDGKPTGLQDAGRISTPTIRICRCPRARRRSIRSSCRGRAATHCSLISKPLTTTFPTQ
jgi:hypothetical protein